MSQLAIYTISAFAAFGLGVALSFVTVWLLDLDDEPDSVEERV